MTTTYELSDVGSTEAIAIPAGCPPGPIDFLVPVDATGVMSAPGQLAFTITGSVKDAVAIVRGGSVIAHWSAGVQVVFDNEAHLAFTAEGLTIDAFVLEVEGGTLVQLTATRD